MLQLSWFLLFYCSLLQQLSILVSKMLTLCSVTLSTSLSVGVFFLQFLDWWYGSDQRVIDVMALPNPGPPQVHGHVSSTNVLAVFVVICRLCWFMFVTWTLVALNFVPSVFIRWTALAERICGVVVSTLAFGSMGSNSSTAYFHIILKPGSRFGHETDLTGPWSDLRSTWNRLIINEVTRPDLTEI